MVKRWLNILIMTVFSLGIGTNLIACSSQTMAKDFIKEEITNNQLLNEEINALKRKITILTNDFQELIKKNNVTKERIGQLEQKLREKITQQESEVAQLIEYTSELTKLINSFGSGELADIAKLLKDNATLEDKLHHIRTEMARLLNKEELIAKNDALKVKIVSTYLERFNANNRFDLRGLNINQQRSYALDKVKIKLQEKFPNIFKHISNLEIYNETWTLGKNAIEVFKDGNTALEIRFKIGVKTSQWIPMYFKNIKNNDEQLFNKVKTYLENFDFSHPFDLEGMTADKKISDVLEKLRKNLKNQFSQEYNRIKIDMSGINKTIEEDGLLRPKSGDYDNNYKQVTLTVGSFNDTIELFFKNIKRTDEQLFNKVKEYLAKFTKNNPFDLEGMTATEQIRDILPEMRKDLKNQFGDESSRIAITMQNVNNTIEEDGLFDLNENYKRVSLTIGSFTGEINVYFKNFNRTDRQLFNKVKEYLAKFTKDNPFDLEGMTIDKKISDVLEKLRKNLKNQFGNESSRITISMYNVNNTIQSDGLLKLDENYKAVIFKVGTFSKEIRVYLDNFQNISDFLNKIIEKDVNFFDEIVDIDYSNNKEDNLINAKKIVNFYKNKFGWKVKVGFTYRWKNFVISLDDYHFKLSKFLDTTVVMPINKSIIDGQDFIKVFG